MFTWSTSAARVVDLPLPVVPGDQDQAALFGGNRLQDLGKAQFLNGLHANGDDAQDEADRAALLEDVAAETAQARHAVREVDLEAVLEFLALLRGHHRGGHPDGVLVREPGIFVRRNEVAAHPHHRVAADLQVKVRGSRLDGELQQFVDVHFRAVLPIHVIGGSGRALIG